MVKLKLPFSLRALNFFVIRLHECLVSLKVNLPGKRLSPYLLCLVLALMHVTVMAQSESVVIQKKNPSPSLFQLKAVIDEAGLKPLKDTPTHYWSDKGVELYANGDLNGAEKSFRLALSDAEQRHAEPRLLATLNTNLGAVLRDEKKYGEAEKLFGRALEQIKAIQVKRQAILDFTSSHFCALLRKMGRFDEAQSLRDMTKDGFVPCNVKDTKVDTGTSTDDILVSKDKEPAASTGELVDWTISVEPGYDSGSDRMRDERCPLYMACDATSGPLDIYIGSDVRPIHLVCKLPPESRKWTYPLTIRETYYLPPPRHPVMRLSSFAAPCKVEPMKMSGKVPFLGREVNSPVRMELPDEEIHAQYQDFVRYE